MEVPSSKHEQTRLIQVGEWITDDQERLELYTGSEAPRAFTVWKQVKVDLGSWKGMRWIVPGMAAALIGIVEHWWWLVLIGGWLLYRYFYMLFIVVRGRRLSKMYVGVVRDLSSRHPMYPSEILAQAVCEDGTVIPVVVSERLAVPIHTTHGSVRTAVAYDGMQEYGRAIAVSAPLNNVANEAQPFAAADAASRSG